jgi:hypothetical protein
MQGDLPHWRRRSIPVLIFLALVLGSCGGGAALLYRDYQSTNYPGATLVSDQNLTRYAPNFVMRRTTAYRTTDAFNKVYNWYSSGFSLGPETYAQSNCILMARSWRSARVLEQSMSVMLCSTPTDRMMFVMRSMTIRYPHL